MACSTTSRRLMGLGFSLIQRGGLMQAEQGTTLARAATTLRSRHTATPALGGIGGSGSTGGPGGPNGGAGGGAGGAGDGRQRLGWWSMLATGGQLALLAGSASARRQEPSPQPNPTIDSTVDGLWAVVGPVLTNLGFSGCVGAAAGVALKKVGQFLAVLIGMAFMALQGLAYMGYVTVNWSSVHKDVKKVLDLNNDGKVDANDFKYAMHNFLGVASHGVPSVGGFLAGFALGMRM